MSGDRLYVTLDYEGGWQNRFEWRLHSPAELRAVAAELGLVCESMCSDYDLEATPSGGAPLMQLVFRRERADTSGMTWEELVADLTARYPLRESKMFGMPCLKRAVG